MRSNFTVPAMARAWGGPHRAQQAFLACVACQSHRQNGTAPHASQSENFC